MTRADPDFALPSSERNKYGCTVTAINLDDGQLHTIARTGCTAVQAITKIAAALDGMAGDWKVRSLSSPQSIMRDLYAHRYAVRGSHRVRMGQVEPTTLPEALLLHKIGRDDLLYRPSATMPAYQGPTAWQR